MKHIENGIILRSTSLGYEHRVWEVVENGWAVKGQKCIVQNLVKQMESKPTKVVVEYLIKFVDSSGYVSYPTIREAVTLLNSNKDGNLILDGVDKPILEWARNKKETLAIIIGLKKWED